MANNVKKEFELYEPMRCWLQTYLEEKYPGATIITVDSHAQTLDLFLEKYGVIDNYPQTVGLDIQIDVLGIVIDKFRSGIVFIEAKKNQLNIRDLGQLWAYCKLCNPLEAFLLSSSSIGALRKIIENFGREDLLDFGDGKTIKKMQIGKWDLNTKAIDFKTLIPKLF